MLTSIDSMITFVVRQAEGTRSKAREWTPGEDEFIRKNLGYMTDKQIGQALGRTEVAVHLRWDRDLAIPGPSKAKDVVTAHKAAEMLGIDTHKIAHWVDMGLIPGRLMAGERKIRLIARVTFERWVVSPSSWIYFNPKKIRDPRLKKLCALRMKDWGDEWWPSTRVAKLHGVETKDVQRLIYRGEIPAVQLPVSLGGRDFDRAWSNWFIKKSDALKAHFIRGKGNTTAWQPTPRGIAFMKKACRQGLTSADICRMMGRPCTEWTLRQYLIRNGFIKQRKNA